MVSRLSFKFVSRCHSEAVKLIVLKLYLNKDRSASKALIQKVTKLGAKAIILTVDVGWESKRTLDVRAKSLGSDLLPVSTEAHLAAVTSAKEAGVSQAIGGYQDHNLTWGDIEFIRRNTHLPIIVKGVQSIEDVQLCVDHGVEGVIIVSYFSFYPPNVTQFVAFA